MEKRVLLNLLRVPLAALVLIYQSAFLALGQIWANKTRSVLTTIGIVIGVASVTSVIAALTGLKQNVLTEFETFGPNKIFVIPERPDTGRMRNAGMNIIRFEPRHFEGMLRDCPSVGAFTRVTSTARNVSHGDRVLENVQVEGIDSAWHKVENRAVLIGQPFNEIHNRQAHAVCIVNKAAQDKLGLDRDPVGQHVLIGDRRFTVIGVIESRVESGMFGTGLSTAEVYVPFNTAYVTRDMQLYVVAVSKSVDVSEEARAEITFFLRRKRGLEPGDPDNFRIEAVERFLQQFRALAAVITIIATGIVGISLLVGGVGIMNIMLVSVSERTREIGLRKAVGAHWSAILLQFLVEATMLCLFGGLIGVLIGEGMVLSLKGIMSHFKQTALDQAAIPGWAIALSFGFSALVGLFFGMFPAIKAARLDPIDALRHE